MSHIRNYNLFQSGIILSSTLICHLTFLTCVRKVYSSPSTRIYDMFLVASGSCLFNHSFTYLPTPVSMTWLSWLVSVMLIHSSPSTRICDLTFPPCFCYFYTLFSIRSDLWLDFSDLLLVSVMFIHSSPSKGICDFTFPHYFVYTLISFHSDQSRDFPVLFPLCLHASPSTQIGDLIFLTCFHYVYTLITFRPDLTWLSWIVSVMFIHSSPSTRICD